MMSKATKQILNHGRAKTAEAQPVRGASPDVVGVPGGSQTGSKHADRSETKVGISPQETLPVISVPGGTEAESQLADKSGANTAVEVFSQGALPNVSVPGGS
jgi:hypothetical protein